MSFLDTVARYLPQVISPTQKKLPLGTKGKWTLIVLLAYFLMKHIPLYGLGSASLSQFASLSVILGADFGSMISLGIGPIVTASIVLQLLNGSGLVKFNTSDSRGRAHYQAINKLLAIAFVVVESAVYVLMGGLSPLESLAGTSLYFTMQLVLIFQLILGGLMIMLLDDLCQKWGLGSGLSLFIAAGVSESLFIRAFSWILPAGADYPAGAFPIILQAFSAGDTGLIMVQLGAIVATIGVFMMAIYFQAMKVEIPLSFGRVRGHGMRWPLNFLYTSNIPVILIAALLANLQLFSSLADNAFGWTWAIGISSWLTAPNLIGTMLQAKSLAIGSTIYLQALSYTIVLMAGSVLFSWFWMQTSGMDAKSQAKKIMASGLQIPGFRKDPRVMEHVLNRYVAPLTIMGGLAIGFLAAIADISGALTSGTGLLLAIMIIYRMYEDVAKQHMEDMNPMMKKMMGK